MRCRGLSLEEYKYWDGEGLCTCHIHPDKFSNKHDYTAPSITCSLDEDISDIVPIDREEIYHILMFI